MTLNKQVRSEIRMLKTTKRTIKLTIWMTRRHSFFLKRKSDQIELFPIWIKELKAKYGIDIKYIRLDNSGENRSLQKECNKQNLGILFEFTAPGTPQQIQLLKEKYLP